MKTLSRFLSEAKNKDLKPVVMAFGRMNPPTTGHAVLVDKVHELAKKHGAHHEVILSHSQDSDKNPLSQEDKIKHAKRYFPNTNITGSTKENPNFISQAKRLNAAGHKHLIMVAGSDRVKEYKDTLNRYNGKEFNFNKIDVVSAGHRDPDAEGISGMSASKMREHAKNKNFKEFRGGIPSHVSDSHAKELYHDVRKGMNLHESTILNKSTMTVNQIADKHGVSIDEIEKQLEMGIKVEKEHTKNEKIAREIALDHLGEVPNYYSKLKKVEEAVGHIATNAPDYFFGGVGDYSPRKETYLGTGVSDGIATQGNAVVLDPSLTMGKRSDMYKEQAPETNKNGTTRDTYGKSNIRQRINTLRDRKKDISARAQSEKETVDKSIEQQRRMLQSMKKTVEDTTYAGGGASNTPYYGKYDKEAHFNENVDIDALVESHLFGTNAARMAFQQMTPGEPGYVGQNKDPSVGYDSREGETSGGTKGKTTKTSIETKTKTKKEDYVGPDYNSRLSGSTRSAGGLGGSWSIPVQENKIPVTYDRGHWEPGHHEMLHTHVDIGDEKPKTPERLGHLIKTSAKHKELTSSGWRYHSGGHSSGMSHTKIIKENEDKMESVKRWASKSETISMFREKYGDKAEEKLNEAMKNMEKRLTEGRVSAMAKLHAFDKSRMAAGLKPVLSKEPEKKAEPANPEQKKTLKEVKSKIMGFKLPMNEYDSIASGSDGQEGPPVTGYAKQKIEKVNEDEITFHGEEHELIEAFTWDEESTPIEEAEYQGRKVSLGKPMAGDVKKSKVYVKGPSGRVVKVNFGDKNMTIKKNIPARRKSFRARHHCDTNPGPRWKARYWSCRAW
jgi:hypothetical protein